MSEKDNDNIYILEDEEREEDNSPLNFAVVDGDGENEDEKEKTREKDKSALASLFKVMFNPVEGWKKIRRSRLTIENIQAGCFYPLLAILAVSKFADYFYSVDVSLSQLITESIVACVSYFFGFFCVVMLINWLMPKEVTDNFEKGYGKQYIMVGMSSLVLFSIVTNILPMLWPILIFLPIWTLYFMFKGVRFFKLPAKVELKFYLLASAGVIGLPLLVEWGLNEILPY